LEDSKNDNSLNENLEVSANEDIEEERIFC